MRLFEDQESFIRSLRAAYRDGAKGVIAQAATGFGKTQVSAAITKEAAARGKSVVFAVHRLVLIQQTHATFKAWGIDHGYIAANTPARPSNVQIASIETLRRRMRKLPPCDLLIVDEAHLACSRTWSEVISFYRDSGALILGNTATPKRLDSKPLRQHFDVIVEATPSLELMEMGRLSKYRLYAPSVPDMKDVRTQRGDYVTSDVEDMIHRQHIVGDAVKHYKKLMPGKRALVFCVSIKASQETAAEFVAGGVPAEHIDGETPPAERYEIISRLASGETKVLSSVALLMEGFDLSSQVGKDVPVEGTIHLRPTQSLVIWLQQVGRGLRKKKEPAIILDHGGLSMRHGLPCESRVWSLDGKAKGPQEERAISLRHCKHCLAVYPAVMDECPLCGTPAERKYRDIEQLDGDLEEVDLQAARLSRRREEGMAQSVGELIAVAKQRGYAKGPAWVTHKVVARTKRDFSDVFGEVRWMWDEVDRWQPVMTWPEFIEWCVYNGHGATDKTVRFYTRYYNTRVKNMDKDLDEARGRMGVEV